MNRCNDSGSHNIIIRRRIKFMDIFFIFWIFTLILLS